MLRWPRWSRSRRARLPDTDRVADDGRAFELAYSYLGVRDRTVAEMRRRLERAKFDAPVIETVVAELIALGYLDDEKFARLFAQDKRTLEDWGNDRIARTLIDRGLDRELVLGALEQAPARELERAVALLRRRFPGPPADLRAHERALGVLARKGYDSDLAYQAVRAWAAESESTAQL